MKVRKQPKVAGGLRKMKTQLESNIGIYLGATGGGFCFAYAITSRDLLFILPASLVSAFWMGLSYMTAEEKLWDEKQQAIKETATFESSNMLSR